MYTVFFATPHQVWRLNNSNNIQEIVREFTDMRFFQITQLTTSLAVIVQWNQFVAACEDFPMIDQWAQIVHCQHLHSNLDFELRLRYQAIFNRVEFRNIC